MWSRWIAATSVLFLTGCASSSPGDISGSTTEAPTAALETTIDVTELLDTVVLPTTAHGDGEWIWPERADAHALLAEFLGHIERGDFEAAAGLLLRPLEADPADHDGIGRLAPESFDAAGVGDALRRWCSEGCDTTVPPMHELTLTETGGDDTRPAFWGIGTGSERIQAVSWEGVTGIDGLPRRGS